MKKFKIVFIITLVCLLSLTLLFAACQKKVCKHEYGDWVTTLEPTCTVEGEETRVCSICGNEDTRKVEATGHSLSKVDAKDSTCLEQGNIEYYHCSVCEKNFAGENSLKVIKDATLPLSDHAYGDWKISIKPTCTKDGEEKRVCSVCGDEEKRVLETTGHSLSKADAKNSTCLEHGNVEYYHCSVCGVNFADKNASKVIGDVSLPLAEHTYGEWVTTITPTCSTEGEETRVCSVCGDEETKPIEITGHDLSKVDAKDSTCLEYGNVEYYHCSVCGVNFADENASQVIDDVSLPLVDHTYGEWVTTTEPTCKNEGEEKRVCSVCGDEETRAIATTEHSYGEWSITIAPTCTTEGEETRVCSICGDKETRTLETTNHVLSKVDAKNSTCLEHGNVEYYHCSVCGVNFADENASQVIEESSLPLVDHTYGEWVIVLEPTCKNEGEEKRICSVCGDEETRVIVTTEHSYGEWLTTIAPTCTTEGEETRVCSICGDKETRTLETTSHALSKVDAKNSTCLEHGNVEYYHCSVCGVNFADENGSQVIEDVSLPLADHSYGEWIIVLEPTCKNEGEEKRVCSVCGDEETRAIATTEHTYGEWTTTIVPTCTTEGEETRVCSICGDKETRTLETTSHVLSKVNAKNSTCLEHGNVEYYHCSVCGVNFADENASQVIEEISLPLVDHTYGEWVTTVEPTYTEEGKEERSCLICNQTEERIIPVLSAPTTYKVVINRNLEINLETLLSDDPNVTVQYYSTLDLVMGDVIKVVDSNGKEYANYEPNCTFKGTALVDGEHTIYLKLYVDGGDSIWVTQPEVEEPEPEYTVSVVINGDVENAVVLTTEESEYCSIQYTGTFTLAVGDTIKVLASDGYEFKVYENANDFEGTAKVEGEYTIYVKCYDDLSNSIYTKVPTSVVEPDPEPVTYKVVVGDIEITLEELECEDENVTAQYSAVLELVKGDVIKVVDSNGKEYANYEPNCTFKGTALVDGEHTIYFKLYIDGGDSIWVTQPEVEEPDPEPVTYKVVVGEKEITLEELECEDENVTTQYTAILNLVKGDIIKVVDSKGKEYANYEPNCTFKGTTLVDGEHTIYFKLYVDGGNSIWVTQPEVEEPEPAPEYTVSVVINGDVENAVVLTAEESEYCSIQYTGTFTLAVGDTIKVLASDGYEFKVYENADEFEGTAKVEGEYTIYVKCYDDMSNAIYTQVPPTIVEPDPEPVTYKVVVGDKEIALEELECEDENVTAQYTATLTLVKGDVIKVVDSNGKEYANYEPNCTFKGTAKVSGEHTIYFKLYIDGGDSIWVTQPEVEEPEPEYTVSVVINGDVENAVVLTAEESEYCSIQYTGTFTLAVGDTIKVVASDGYEFKVYENANDFEGTVKIEGEYTIYVKCYDNMSNSIYTKVPATIVDPDPTPVTYKVVIGETEIALEKLECEDENVTAQYTATLDLVKGDVIKVIDSNGKEYANYEPNCTFKGTALVDGVHIIYFKLYVDGGDSIWVTQPEVEEPEPEYTVSVVINGDVENAVVLTAEESEYCSIQYTGTFTLAVGDTIKVLASDGYEFKVYENATDFEGTAKIEGEYTIYVKCYDDLSNSIYTKVPATIVDPDPEPATYKVVVGDDEIKLEELECEDENVTAQYTATLDLIKGDVIKVVDSNGKEYANYEPNCTFKGTALIDGEHTIYFKLYVDGGDSIWVTQPEIVEPDPTPVTYKVVIGDNEIELEELECDDENVSAQYTATLDLIKDDVIKIVDSNGKEYANYEPNCTFKGTALVDGEHTIYFKLYVDGGDSIWVTQLEVEEPEPTPEYIVSVVINGDVENAVVLTAEESEYCSIQYTGTFTLAIGDTIKVVASDGYEFKVYENANDFEGTAKIEGEYTIYVKCYDNMSNSIYTKVPATIVDPDPTPVTYKVVIGETEIALEELECEDENVTAQYTATLNLVKGEVIKVVDSNGKEYANYEPNCTFKGTALVDGEHTIYLKLYVDGGDSIWVTQPEIEEPEYTVSVVINGDVENAVVLTAEESEYCSIQYTGTFTLAVGDTIKVVASDGYEFKVYENATDFEGTAKIEGEYTIYVKCYDDMSNSIYTKVPATVVEPDPTPVTYKVVVGETEITLEELECDDENVTAQYTATLDLVKGDVIKVVDSNGKEYANYEPNCTFKGTALIEGEHTIYFKLYVDGGDSIWVTQPEVEDPEPEYTVSVVINGDIENAIVLTAEESEYCSIQYTGTFTLAVGDTIKVLASDGYEFKVYENVTNFEGTAKVDGEYTIYVKCYDDLSNSIYTKVPTVVEPDPTPVTYKVVIGDNEIELEELECDDENVTAQYSAVLDLVKGDVIKVVASNGKEYANYEPNCTFKGTAKVSGEHTIYFKLYVDGGDSIWVTQPEVQEPDPEPVTYKVVVGDDEIELKELECDDENVTAQYTATLELVTGDVIKVVDSNGKEYANYEPNCTFKGTALVDGEHTIYLKLYVDGGDSIWVTQPEVEEPEPAPVTYKVVIGDDEIDLEELECDDENVTAQYTATLDLVKGDVIKVVDSNGKEYANYEPNCTFKGTAKVSGEHTIYFKLYVDGGDSIWVTQPEVEEPEPTPEYTVSVVINGDVENAVVLTAEESEYCSIQYTGTFTLAVGDTIKVLASDGYEFKVYENATDFEGTAKVEGEYSIYVKCYDDLSNSIYTQVPTIIEPDPEPVTYKVVVGDKEIALEELECEDENVTAQYTATLDLVKGDVIKVVDSNGKEFANYEPNCTFKSTALVDGEHTIYFKLYVDGGDSIWVTQPEVQEPDPEPVKYKVVVGDKEIELEELECEDENVTAQYTATLDLVKGDVIKVVDSNGKEYANYEPNCTFKGTALVDGEHTIYFKLYVDSGDSIWVTQPEIVELDPTPEYTVSVVINGNTENSVVLVKQESSYGFIEYTGKFTLKKGDKIKVIASDGYEYVKYQNSDSFSGTAKVDGEYTIYVKCYANMTNEIYTVVPEVVNPDKKDITVYYYNSNNWANVYAYAWNSSGNAGGWPGIKMMAVEGHANWYSVTISNTMGNIIFNNGGNGQQTGDLVLDNSKDTVYYKNNAWVSSF